MLRIHLISLAYARQLPLTGEAFRDSGALIAFPLRGRWHFRKKMTDEVYKRNRQTVNYSSLIFSTMLFFISFLIFA